MYKYRFMLAAMFFVSVILIFYLYTMKSLLLQKTKANAEKKSAEIQLMKSQMNGEMNKKTLPIVITTKEIFLEDVLLKAHQHHLFIKSISAIGEENMMRQRLYALTLSITGIYADINDFLQDLNALNSPIFFLDFSLQRTSETMLNANIHLVRLKKIRMQTQAKPIKNIANPFCHPALIREISLQKASALINLQDVPLSQLRPVGYLQKQNESMVWFLTPGGHLTSVQLGAKIGKEKAIITNIQKNQVRLQLAKGEVQSLSF